MWHLMSLTLSFLCYLSAINRSDAAPITDVGEVTVPPSRFGYLDLGYQNSSHSPILLAESFRKAIEDFQSFAGLNKTGKFDTETKKLINKPRCGVPDQVIRPGSSSTRQKRFTLQGGKWPKKQLTYQIKNYTTDMTKSDVDREIARAFQMWADVTDLTFVHINNESDNVDIEILFASGEHGDCPSFNDGPGGALAHAAFPIYGGDAHFDESETWTLNSDKGTNLFQVATHNIGHSLGLEHTNVTKAVMYPIYEYSSDFKLDKDDIEGIQQLYGEKPSWKLAIELIKATKEEWTETKNKLEAELIETKKELEKTRADLSKTVDLLSTNLNARTSEIVDIGRMPTSCTDLQRMGYKLSGFFLVKGSKKMETVYCNFYSNGKALQRRIGYADVKSAPVHFYVQRSSSFNSTGIPIPFTLARVNEGNALNLTSGIFTAPRQGTYYFSFTGVAEFPASSSKVWLGVGLYLNGGRIGVGYVEEAKTSGYHFTPLTLQSTLKLKKDDRVWVGIDLKSLGAHLVDMIESGNHHTHFTGLLLEEEIVASH